MITKNKKRRALLSAALVLASAGVFAGPANALLSNTGTGAGPTFEGNDANTAGAAILPNGKIDWANLVSSGGSLSVGPDAATGQCDNSFTQGSKEDETAVVIGQGSIPNSKADLGQFAVGSMTVNGGARDGHVIMALAWVRNNLSGTTNFDFEINQRAQPNMTFAGCPAVDRAVTLVRRGDATISNTAGGALPDDLLISYDVQGGAQNPTLSFRRWTGSAWSNPTTINSADSEGALNTSTVITTAQNGPFARVAGTSGTTAIPASMFGEGDIDMTALGIIPNQHTGSGCVAFGSAYVKSRASSSFTAQMKDYIAPIAIDLDTCASITIDKVTDPAGATQSFGFTATGAGTSNFSLTDTADPQVFNGLVPGNYSFTELAAAGWDLTALNCTESVSTVGSSLSVGTRVASIKLDPSENVVCTYNNALQRGSITVDKVTDPAGSTQEFTFTPSYNSGATFNLADGTTPNASGPLLPGNYSVSEGTVNGWSLTSATCTDTDADGVDAPSAITVSPGENVVCTFNNQARGNIIVHKTVDPADSTQTFEFTTNYGDAFFLGNEGINDSGALVPGSYSVAETQVDGFASSGTCNDTSPGGDNPATLTLDPGETIDCYFTNTQGSSITVVKHVVGPDPDGQSFDFSSDFNGQFALLGGADTGAVSVAPNGVYSVSEDGEDNWLLVSATCSDDSDPSSISVAAGENVICTFTNERQVGALKITKTAKNASAPEGVAPVAGVSFEVTDAKGVVDTYTTGADGTVCVNNYGFQTLNVHELVPAGYAPIEDQQVVIDAVSYCDPEEYGAAPVDASFVNVPLTDVSIVVHSQVAGATSTIIDCGAAGSTTVSDGQLDFTDLLPTDPAATLTCTITVDP